MSDSLTTLISKVQAILGDNGTIFTTATVTAAARQALDEWNYRAPIFAAITIPGINNQHEYELTDEDADSCEITDVLLEGTANNEIDISIGFDSYVEDERIFFRLRTPITTSQTLIVRYTKYHTINGLDSATESTIPARYNQAIVMGTAFYSIYIRAISRVESNNVNKQIDNDYREMAGGFATAFAARMATAARTRRPAVSEPDTRHWADPYETWDQ